MLVGAFTRGPNDPTEQLYAHSQDHKQVRDMFLLIQKNLTNSDGSFWLNWNEAAGGLNVQNT